MATPLISNNSIYPDPPPGVSRKLRQPGSQVAASPAVYDNFIECISRGYEDMNRCETPSAASG